MGKTIKRISLGLQGGGAHGAFTWGVLDRFLEEERLEFAAISGTSAGALNGAALKSGWVRDGRAGARAELDGLWRRMSDVNDLRFPAWMGIPEKAGGAVKFWWEAAVASLPVGAMMQAVSPYAYGPFYVNPLAQIVAGFDRAFLCDEGGPALFVSATNVRSGKIRVFSGADVSAEAVLASACLPSLFQAVEIGGEAYWDGGFTGNPALFPLFEPELPSDLLIVNINPLWREDIPRSPQEIHDRVSEISFNSSLLRELRAIDFVQRLIESGAVAEGQMKRLFVHMVADDALMQDLAGVTKMVPLPTVIARLKDAGRAAAEAFLSAHWDDLGARSSVDLRSMFGDVPPEARRP